MLQNSFNKLYKFRIVSLPKISYSEKTIRYNQQSVISKWDLFKINSGITKLRFPIFNIHSSAHKLYAIASGTLKHF